MLKPAFVAFITWALLGCQSAPLSMTASEAGAVTAAVEQFRQANLKPTELGLSTLLAEELTYGHSGAKVDTKASLMNDLVGGSVKFSTLTFSDQKVILSQEAAVVRHIMAGDVAVDGKSSTVKIAVLQVWQKQGAQWRLLARQGVTAP